MKTIILLLWSLGVYQAQPSSFDPPYSHMRQKVVTGSMDKLGVCHCSLAIPDAMFPTERMELLETSNLNLSLKFQEEINKIQGYQHKLDIYLENLKNLTRKVELCGKEGDSYSQIAFEMLKLEISELKSLVEDLRSSLSYSNEKVETLYSEVQNISVIVNKLERHDKNNILTVRREIASLQKRLSECKESHSPFHVQFGTCEHGRIVNVSKPQVIQVNWRGSGYKLGGWGKDSFFGSTQELYWVLASDGNSYFSRVRFYSSYKSLKEYKVFKDQAMSYHGRGSGSTLYNNSLYYNCNSRDICKLNIDTNKVDYKTVPDAATRFSYAGTSYQDLDLEGDEYGLWVIYSKEASLGNIVIGLLNRTSLDVIRTWTTSVYKPIVTNAFMVCGVLYATRTLNTREEEIFYMYDTNTSEEHHLKITFEKLLDNIQSLTYNANDNKLYMYNDGFEVTYSLLFKPVA